MSQQLQVAGQPDLPSTTALRRARGTGRPAARLVVGGSGPVGGWRTASAPWGRSAAGDGPDDDPDVGIATAGRHRPGVSDRALRASRIASFAEPYARPGTRGRAVAGSLPISIRSESGRTRDVGATRNLYHARLTPDSSRARSSRRDLHERARHRIVVRRDRRSLGRGRPPSAPVLARAGAAQPGRPARRLRRRRSRARFARPHPPRAAAGRAGARRGRQAAGDIDLVAYTRGPGLAGALLVGAGVASALAAALARAGARRSSPGRASAVAVPLGRSAGVPVRRPARLRRPHAAAATSTTSAAMRCSATRSTTPPAKRSTSRPSCSASAIRADRRWRGWPSSATRGLRACRGRCCQRDRSTSRSPA